MYPSGHEQLFVNMLPDTFWDCVVQARVLARSLGAFQKMSGISDDFRQKLKFSVRIFRFKLPQLCDIDAEVNCRLK